MKFYFLFIFYLSFIGNIQLVGQSKSAVLNTFLQSDILKHAAVSLKAIDLTTGKTIVSYNENMALTPASNMKLVTTATALDLLGENFYYETPVVYDGFIQNSILKGNLYIKGSGDPTLGSEFIEDDKEFFLKEWLVAINKAGIKCISGNIIVLDHLFGYEGISPKTLWEDMGNYYASGIYGISVFDNMYRVYLQSFASGSETTVLSTEPEMDEIRFTNEIKASESNNDESFISGVPFSNARRLYGSIPANRSSFTIKGDIPDPGLFLAQYFCSYLKKNGVEVIGKATTFRLNPVFPEKEKMLGSVHSKYLASIVRVINVRSNNHYAEALYKELSLLRNIKLADYWREKGLDSNALIMFDGSGISPLNAVSSGFLVDLLVYMDHRTGKTGAFYQSLPLAGKEGTVASFLKNTSLAGKAYLKSGSLTNVQSYSGYIEKGSERYAISLIINNFTGKRADLKKQIEKLLVGLF
ncbi:MAG: D-alanyl-D-alanine carboxypeptidase/D-alanyl-D-alanine-endopeptidase [Dysgonamonadaceae bacterium]|jgi:D-alanyl-D-alanine carboxypeptidase/D-alanyl-D-alanine-endopeptidase (penicillin-binding protein 4)|nr:D-alanyl-D-alanine carboxypeptidase/D-alanyl-D-alanine-endopeptidase [Dysgonamonadaceae bacterium]